MRHLRTVAWGAFAATLAAAGALVFGVATIVRTIADDDIPM